MQVIFSPAFRESSSSPPFSCHSLPSMYEDFKDGSPFKGLGEKHLNMWFRILYCALCSLDFFSSLQFTQSCPTLCNPMDCSTPGLPVHHQLSRSLLKLMSIESVMPSNHLILGHPLLLPPSILPSIKVFSNESVLRIRWPKYWSFSFSISPSKEGIQD